MNKPAKVSTIDKITNLIQDRPGIRDIEIAEEINVDVTCVRPMIHSRISNSRIIVDKVNGMAGRLINAYRINPLWTPADDNFKPAPSAKASDIEVDTLPMRQIMVPAGEKRPLPIKKVRQPRKARSAPEASPVQAVSATPAVLAVAPAVKAPTHSAAAESLDGGRTQAAADTPAPGQPPKLDVLSAPVTSTSLSVVKAARDIPDTSKPIEVPAAPPVANSVKDAGPGIAPAPVRHRPSPNQIEPAAQGDLFADEAFVCAVYHDGRGEIRKGGATLILTPEEAAIVARHFGYTRAAA